MFGRPFLASFASARSSRRASTLEPVRPGPDRGGRARDVVRSLPEQVLGITEAHEASAGANGLP
jgi:hypothetical protein